MESAAGVDVVWGKKKMSLEGALCGGDEGYNVGVWRVRGEEKVVDWGVALHAGPDGFYVLELGGGFRGGHF